MRIYDGKYLSVTSIIELREPFNNKAFEDYCKANGLDSSLMGSNSRVLGEVVGRVLEDSYHGLLDLSQPSRDMLEVRLVKGVKKFLEDYKLVESEQEVKCEDLHYAGRYDGIVEEKGTGKLFLADWKTYGAHKATPYKRDSKKIKHARWQLTLYSHAIGWEHEIAVVVFKNDGNYELEILKFDEDMISWVKENKKLIKETIDKFSNK